ncbi:hypothetical protein PRIPAC_86615 [Pristionchus pacificus]|uniref:Peptidase n=1 Tax=Pristionchus pacificus TaxID=54126 RepID=A0A2A6BNG8_PRIPA|nr:hypothetical protein PRIPAC_86615 [Pristionchus pacificus]|eukprot:PDM67465.1 Peptidase [Pristionchus pacificus]
MYKNVTHVFLNDRLILENGRFCATESGESLVIVDSNGNKHACNVEDVGSLEFYFHETGPSMAPVYNVIIVLRFAKDLIFLCGPVSPVDSFVLTVSDAFKMFNNIQFLVIKFSQILKKDVVKAVPFTRMPRCVKEVIVQVGRDYESDPIRREGKETHDCATKEPKAISNDGVVDLFSDEEAGIKSLEPGLYLNDEIINLALRLAVKKYPSVCLFDTYETDKIFRIFKNGEYDVNSTMEESVFKNNFAKYFFKGKGNEETPRELEDTFFDKKMLLFPICQSRHWYLVVVVNPLLADVHNYLTPAQPLDTSAMAYFIDSLHGLKGHDTMGHRVNLTWTCIFSFIRLAASFYAHSYLSPNLITCVYESNLPPQTNNSDCGAHLVHNTELMAELYDVMIKAPPKVRVSEEQREKVMEKVNGFRTRYKTYLERCNLKGNDN